MLGLTDWLILLSIVSIHHTVVCFWRTLEGHSHLTSDIFGLNHVLMCAGMTCILRD